MRVILPPIKWQKMPDYLKDIKKSPDLDKAIDPAGTILFMSVGYMSDPLLKNPVSRNIQRKYGARALALITGPRARPILDKQTSKQFITYQKKLKGVSINPLFVDFERIDKIGLPFSQIKTHLVGAPLRSYFTMPSIIKEAKKYGYHTRDWNENNIKVREKYDDKVVFHKLGRGPIRDIFIAKGLISKDDHIIAKPRVAKKHILGKSTMEEVERIKQIYVELTPKLKRFYKANRRRYTPFPPGVAVRPLHKTGNYDSFLAYQANEGYIISFEGHKEIYPKKDNVIARINELTAKGNPSTEYVITRYLDLLHPPGLNVFITDNFSYVAPPTSQIFQGMRCIGTGSLWKKGFNPFNNSSRFSHARKWVWVLAEIMRSEGARGFVGVDTMITGFFEKAFARAVKSTIYEDEAVGPTCFAEVNARLTQRTTHMLTQLAIKRNIEKINRSPLTIRELIQGYESTGNGIDYISYDSFPFRVDDPLTLLAKPAFRHIMAGLNGTPYGAYIMMPPVDQTYTMGVGIVGKNPHHTITLLDQLSHSIR